MMTQSPREMLHSDVRRGAPSCTRLPLRDRIEKKHRHCKTEASRHRTFKSVSPEIQVGLVWLRGEGAVQQPRCHDAGPGPVRQASEPLRRRVLGPLRMRAWRDTVWRP